jgi:hypothetical protein
MFLPLQVIGERNNDLIIVGCGIIKAKDLVIATREYQKAWWTTYE